MKIKFYFLLSVLAAFIITGLIRHNQALKMDEFGLTYREIDVKTAILNPQYYQIIALNKNGRLMMYKALEEHPETGIMSYIFHDYDIASKYHDTIFTQWNLITYLTQRKIAPHQEIGVLRTLDLEQRKALFKASEELEARAYIPPSQDTNDLFTKIEDSVFVFLPLAIIPFLIMMLHDLLIFLFAKRKNDVISRSIQIGFLLLCALIFSMFLNPVYYAASYSVQYLLAFIVVFSLYFLFQWELKHIQAWQTIKHWREDYKFLVLFLGGCLIIYLANLLCRFIDLQVFDSDGITTLATGGRMPLEMGFAFSFAFGNMLNNIRKYIFAWRRQSKQVKHAEAKALTSEAELNAMQASVNPHFLYNSLNSIASLAQKNPEKTERMAIELSKFYRYQTNRKRAAMSSLSEEIEMIQSYLKIEKIRFGDRLAYKIDPITDIEDIKVPHFLLQPIVENAIKYGYDDASDKIEIAMKFEKNNDQLEIKIFDGGKAFSDQLRSGYGLKSVMKKLAYAYPDQHEISFISEPNKHVLIAIFKL